MIGAQRIMLLVTPYHIRGVVMVVNAVYEPSQPWRLKSVALKTASTVHSTPITILVIYINFEYACRILYVHIIPLFNKVFILDCGTL